MADQNARFAQTQCFRQTKLLGRERQPPLQDQPCCQGQVKEDMREQHTMQAVDLDLGKAQGCQNRVQIPD